MSHDDLVGADLVEGDDGRLRCRWGTAPEIYRRYHDHEWGRPVVDDDALFEKLCLEGFQAGLSWLTILNKREAFRAGFRNFSVPEVAAFGPEDVERLLQDASIIRHRGKIEAAVNNAKAVLEVQAEGSLSELIWSFRPANRGAIHALGDVPATSPESTAMSKELKRRGFRFVGPTTMYALMQAMGLVNDHLVGCWVHAEVAEAQAAVVSR